MEKVINRDFEKEVKVLDLLEEKEQTEIKLTTPVVTVAFSSVFTVVTTFFTGILISKYSDYDFSVNIPTLFLIISTFGFLYSTIVYANTNGLIQVHKLKKAAYSIFLGNVLSEYLGIYFLVLAIPLIINVISKDPFLRTSTLIVDLGGLFVYHISGISIMERNYKKLHLLFFSIIVLLELGLVTFQFKNIAFFELVTTILISFIVLLAVFARKESL